MTPQEAGGLNGRTFRADKPCRANHDSDSYVYSGKCVECVRIKNVNYKRAIREERAQRARTAFPNMTDPLPSHLRDAITELDAAGFAVVPKKPNTNIVTALALAYSDGGEGWVDAADLREWGIRPNAESEWMAGAWRAALAVALVPVREGERSDIDAYEAALKARKP